MLEEIKDYANCFYHNKYTFYGSLGMCASFLAASVVGSSEELNSAVLQDFLIQLGGVGAAVAGYSTFACHT